MSQIFICLSVALVGGLLMSRPAKKLGLPAVTAYLLAGLLLGPFCLGAIGIPGLGFNTAGQVAQFNIISQAALGFIAFAIGDEFRLEQLRSMGHRVIIVGIAQAVITTAVVDAALVALHYMNPGLISLPAAITLGAIAAATAPAATLMVVRQYKADGPLTHLLLMVVAIDDAVGLVLFSASFGVATAMESGAVSIISVLVEPVIEIVLSLVLGGLSGFFLHRLEQFFHSRSKRRSLSIGFVLLTVGLSMVELEVGGVHIGFSLLLTCMMAGTVFCNICRTSQEIMERVDHWTAPLNILFFVISGAELDLGVLSQPLVLLVGVVYILFRSLGKFFGAYASCAATGCEPKIRNHLGITLLPQAGVALGMTLTAQTLSDGNMVRNVVLFSVLVYELVGPALTKRSLMAAGEIKPEGKTSARTMNVAKEPVKLESAEEQK